MGLDDFSIGKIVKIDKDMFTVQKYNNIKSFFQRPLPSEEAGIFYVSDLGETVEVTRDRILLQILNIHGDRVRDQTQIN